MKYNVELFEEGLHQGWSKKVNRSELVIKDETNEDIYIIDLDRQVHWPYIRSKIVVRQVGANEFIAAMVTEDGTRGISRMGLCWCHLELRNGKTRILYRDYEDYFMCDNFRKSKLIFFTDKILLFETERFITFYYLELRKSNTSFFRIEKIEDTSEESIAGYIGIRDDGQGLLTGYYNPITRSPITPCYSKLRQRNLVVSSIEEQIQVARSDSVQAGFARDYAESMHIMGFFEAKEELLKRGNLEEIDSPKEIECPFLDKIDLFSFCQYKIKTTKNQIIFMGTRNIIRVIELGGRCKGVKQIGTRRFIIYHQDAESGRDCVSAIELGNGKIQPKKVNRSESCVAFLSKAIFTDGETLYCIEPDGKICMYESDKVAYIKDGGYQKFAAIRHTSLCKNSYRFVDIETDEQIGGIFVPDTGKYVKGEEESEKYLREVKYAEDFINKPTKYDETEPDNLRNEANQILRSYYKTMQIPH